MKVIKKATNSHIDNIVNIEKESYQNPWTKKHFSNDISHSYAMNYVFIYNKELIGYLFGYLINGEYHLNKITIKNIYRGKSIGKELFLYCLKKLRDKRVKCIQLEVSSLNLIAQKFYKNLNFIYTGVRKDYYSKNEDALLYILRLK